MRSGQPKQGQKGARRSVAEGADVTFRAWASAALGSVVLAAALGGCSHPDASVIPGTDAPNGGAAAPAIAKAPRSKKHVTPVKVTIRIPKAERRPKPRRIHGHYISPATQSVVINVYDARHSQLLTSTTVNTTPGSPNCTTSATYKLVCNVGALAPFGSDSFDVLTYDQTNGYGNPLSAVIGYPFVVTTGSALGLTLNAIPASMGITHFGNLIDGHPELGLQMAGLPQNSQKISIFSYDADNYVIVGPGAPTYALTASPSSAVTIVPAGSQAFYVNPNGFTKQPITLTATVTPGNYGAGLPLTQTTTLQLEPLVWVNNFGNSIGGIPSSIAAYKPEWSKQPLYTLSTASYVSNSFGTYIDSASGDLYVSSDSSGTVTEYSSASSNLVRSIPGIANNRYGLVTDANGTLYASSTSNATVTEYAAGTSTSPSLTIHTGSTNSSAPYGLAIDKSGTLYVADLGLGQVSVYPSGQTTPSFVMSNGMSGPWRVVFDKSGNMFVSNFTGNNVTEYSPPFSASSMPVKTFSSGVRAPSNIAVDGSGNLYVVNLGGGSTQPSVQELTPSGSPSRVFGSSQNQPADVAIDGTDQVYIAYQATGLVGSYPAGTSMSPNYFLSTGIAYPFTLAIWP